MSLIEQFNHLESQVRRAYRRLWVQTFLGRLSWTLFAALWIALVALVVPKFWILEISWIDWMNGWLAGAIVWAVVSAGIWTWMTRRGKLDAAIEIDHRFGLKERVSSVLALGVDRFDGSGGAAEQALLQDAVHNVERIDVLSRFPLKLSWRMSLPIVPGIVAFALAFLPNAEQVQKAEAKVSSIVERKRIENSTKKLKKQLTQRRQVAENLGLQDAKDLFDKLEQGLEQLSESQKTNRRDSLAGLSNLSKELKERREALGDSNTIQQQFDRLKNLKRGPADNLSKAIKHGKFSQAVKEIENLKTQLEQGGLSIEQQQQLAGQMQQIGERLAQLAAAHLEARQELQRQIDELKRRDDRDQADELQRRLDQMSRAGPQMNRLEQMAEKLKLCSKCLDGKKGEGEGNSSKVSAQSLATAMDQLDSLASDLARMTQDLQEMAMLDGALNQLVQARDAMSCGKCNGKGCDSCQGNRGKRTAPTPQGQGLGGERGTGDRAEQEMDTRFYDTQSGGDSQPGGRGVIVGELSGPNISGKALEELKMELNSAKSDDADPLAGKRLPRKQRDHVRQYLRSFREGN